MTPKEYSHVLWAADLSEHAESIGARARDMAQRYGAKLSAIHAVAYMPPFEFGGELALPPYREIEEQIVEQARERLEKFAVDFSIPNKQVHVVTGSARYEIVRFAKENAVDLIVVGRHSRRGLGLLLGSTATGVLHSATCDVLAILI